jgi:hypothetical protein
MCTRARPHTHTHTHTIQINKIFVWWVVGRIPSYINVEGVWGVQNGTDSEHTFHIFTMVYPSVVLNLCSYIECPRRI